MRPEMGTSFSASLRRIRTVGFRYGQRMQSQDTTPVSKPRVVAETTRDWPLPMLIFTGIVITLCGGAALTYAQAEILTAPGVAVWSALTSSQLLDIARTTTFALGAIGGIAALLMAYRRQKLNEVTHQHEIVKHDATHALEQDKQRATRVTGLHERYSTAVEQLARDDKASIRLGAVHAIEALAEDWLAIDNHRQRQVCVNLLCSYLNSLDEPRSENSILNIVEQHDDVDEAKLRRDSTAAANQLWDDRSVRKAIFEALSDILVADHNANRKPAIVDLRGATFGNGLDLTNARLAHLPLDHKDLRGVSLKRANLSGANLSGANLRRVNLSQTDLTGADLTGARLLAHRIDGVALQGAILTRGCWAGASQPMDTTDEWQWQPPDTPDEWQTKVRRLLRNGRSTSPELEGPSPTGKTLSLQQLWSRNHLC